MREPTMSLLIFYVTVAIMVSFLCSLLEATLLTITPSTINRSKQAGYPWAVRMDKLKADVDRPLSAILTLNTIANTMGAAAAGAQWAKISGSVPEAVFGGGLTLGILLFGEIIPKTLGASFANHLARPASIVLLWMMRVLAPIVWLSRKVTRLITPRDSSKISLHREELLAMTRMGEESGSLGETESRFVQNLIQLHAMKTWDIMTPRPVIVSLPESTSLIEFVKFIEDKPFTRIPIYRSNRDDIHGFVLRGDALLAHLKDHDDTGTLAEVARPVKVTPDSTPVDLLFRRFISERSQIMMVADEFGTIVGLVTFEDIIETIFGFEIMDEKDKIPDLQLQARNLWLERAKKMGIELPAEETPVR